MVRELIEKYYELQSTGEIDEFLNSCVKEQYIDLYDDSCARLDQYNYRIRLNEDGLYITGPMIRWIELDESESLTLAKFDAYMQIDMYRLISEVAIDSLDENEEKLLWDSLLEYEEIRDLCESYNSVGYEVNLKDIFLEEEETFVQHFESIVPGRLDTFKEEFAIDDWSNFGYDNIISQIESNIKFIEESIKLKNNLY